MADAGALDVRARWSPVPFARDVFAERINGDCQGEVPFRGLVSSGLVQHAAAEGEPWAVD